VRGQVLKRTASQRARGSGRLPHVHLRRHRLLREPARVPRRAVRVEGPRFREDLSVYFLDGDNGLGAVAEVSGKPDRQAGDRPSGAVRLGLDATRRPGRPSLRRTQAAVRAAAPLHPRPDRPRRARHLPNAKEVQADSIRVLSMVSVLHVRTDARDGSRFPCSSPGRRTAFWPLREPRVSVTSSRSASRRANR